MKFKNKADKFGYYTAGVIGYISIIAIFTLMLLMEHTDGSINMTAVKWQLISMTLLVWSMWRTKGELL